MADNRIYETIATRTGGDIYIGVVGPVRSGKSTFIQKFMECAVIPNIENEYDRGRAKDELPQSAAGRTITTTEPKFIPAEAVRIRVGDTEMRVRLIDCVGYMAEGALGNTEDGAERMVLTPWSESPIPFSLAGEIGTEQVIKEHSTIAVVVSTDGTICDIPRESYAPAEERIVGELKDAGKPFALILNSARPESEEAHRLANELEEKYRVPVALLSCTELNGEDIREILSLVVGEFPLKELKFTLPEWYPLLPEDEELRISIESSTREFALSVRCMSDVERLCPGYNFKVSALDAEIGSATVSIPVSTEHFYSVISDVTGLDIHSDKALFTSLISLSEANAEYQKIKSALSDAKTTGYGIVMPCEDELTLGEPKLVKQHGGWGIKVSASADTIHMIRADIKTDVCTMIGSEEGAEEVIKVMEQDYEENPKKLLSTKILGRSLYDLVNDGMNTKLLHIPYESREKLGQALERIINEGANGLICILV